MDGALDFGPLLEYSGRISRGGCGRTLLRDDLLVVVALYLAWGSGFRDGCDIFRRFDGLAGTSFESSCFSETVPFIFCTDIYTQS